MPFTEGGCIERYYFKKYGWLKYSVDEHYNSMFSELFENEKIMFINVVKDTLRFAYDNKEFYNSHTVINCVRYDLLKSVEHVSVKRALKNIDVPEAKKYQYYFLMALLNSRLINWYFRNFLSEGLHFYPDDAKNLPIKKTSAEKQIPFIALVDKILKLTSAENYDPKNPPAKQKELEKQIDELVFDLYELTDEEKEIIRKS